MNNKIFISHSSKDIEIVKLFVEKVLQLGLNIERDRIFCSSMKGYDVKSGEYIPDRLKTEINSSIISLLFISNNYKESEVCINEIGASWAVLEKDRTIPLLLPDIDFDKIGFLDINRLGLKLLETDNIIKLIEDCKNELSSNYNLSVLTEQIKTFIEEAKKLLTVPSKPFKKKEISEWDRCFTMNLYPFSEILVKSVPTLNEGIHNIIDKKKQTRILTNLSKANFLNHLWYKFSGGDSYVEHITLLENGNWLMSGSNWEMKISSMWISTSSSLQNNFLLFKSEKLLPYEITSDIGGKEYHVGLMNNGTIVSENERSSGYAEINNEIVDLHECETVNRRRKNKSHWVFIGSDYHKIGNNPDEAIKFCNDLDNNHIQVNEENLYDFFRNLRSHITVIQNQ